MNTRFTYFGQEFPSTFRQREGEKELAAWNKSTNIAAGVKSNPIAEGGMRFTFPPYGHIVRHEITAIYVFQATQ